MSSIPNFVQKGQLREGRIPAWHFPTLDLPYQIMWLKLRATKTS